MKILCFPAENMSFPQKRETIADMFDPGFAPLPQ